MSSRRIFVIGATGAQGLPVCRGLVNDGAYSLRVLTRAAHENWRALATLSLSREHGEILDHSYELAVETDIKFFLFANLDYGYEKSGYDPKFRCGHYDGKGRMAEWVLSQNGSSDMGVSVFTTGSYIEMAISSKTVMTPRLEYGIVTWRVPLRTGAVPHVPLVDCEHYAHWLFGNPERSIGMNLEVAIDHISYADLAAAFQKVTGTPAQYIDMPMSLYFQHIPMSDEPAGYNADPKDSATMTFKQNFTGFWNMWTHSGGNKGVIKRDYALLDEIRPKRIRSAEEFFRL